MRSAMSAEAVRLTSSRLPISASEAPCVLVTIMLGAKCLRKRNVEGGTRDETVHELRSRSGLEGLTLTRRYFRDAGLPGEAGDNERADHEGDGVRLPCCVAAVPSVSDSVSDSCCSASCVSVDMHADRQCVQGRVATGSPRPASGCSSPAVPSPLFPRVGY